MGTIQLVPAGVDIKAQSLPQLKINIAQITAGVEFNIGTITGTVNVNITQVDAGVTFNVAAQAGYFFIRTEVAQNINIAVKGSDIMMPIDLQGSYIMMPIDIQAQYMNLAIDIVAQTIGNIKMDIAAQTIGNIKMDIASQTIGNIDIRIAGQVENVSINLQAQTVAIKSQGEWSPQLSQQKYFTGYSSLASFGSTAFKDSSVPTGKKRYITHLSFSISASGSANAGTKCIGMLALQLYGGEYKAFLGGDGGAALSVPTPIRFESDEVVRMVFQNCANFQVEFYGCWAGYDI